MTSPTTDRRQGLVGNTPIKAPVACASTTPLTLSGEQTIDGVLTSTSRVLVMGQADATTNGIYDTSSAAWTRSQDADGNYDLVTGTLVFVAGGNTFAGRFYTVATTGAITIGTSALTFQQSLTSSTSVLSFIAAGVGALVRGAQDKMRDFLTDRDFTTLQQAITAAAALALPLHVIGVWANQPSLTVPSNVTLWLEQGSSISTSTPNISVLNATGSSNVRIEGTGKIAGTAAGASSHVGLVDFTNSTGCTIVEAEITGFQWAGVLLSGATRPRLIDLYIHDFIGTVQDCAGVQAIDGCTKAKLVRLDIANPGYHGVNVQETGGGLVPTHTRIIDCDISVCKVYGINCYNKTNGTTNQFTQIRGGSISDVQGGAPYNTSGGAGVYLLQAGGCSVTGLEIEYVCSKTSDNSLVPAGVGVNVSSPLIPPFIEGITFRNIGFTPGGVQNPNAVTLAAIAITSGTAGANIGANVMLQDTANTGGFSYVGIYVNGASNVTIAPQHMTVPNGSVNSVGIFLFANTVNVSDCVVNVGVMIGFDYAHVRLDQSGGFHVAQTDIFGGATSGGSVNCIPLRITQAQSVSVYNFTCAANTAAALTLSASTNCIFSGGRFVSSGAQDIATSGACNGSFIDETVLYGADARISNAGTGCTIKTRSNAAPIAGTWAVGDIREQSTPVVGSPKRWRCTVAGAPGTWVSEGNL